MVAEPKPARTSIAEYLKLENASALKHEYVDGSMILLAGGSRNHSRLAVRTLGALERRLQAGPCRTYNSEVRVRINDRYFYPDISVSCDDRDSGEGDDLRCPSVIFEVLSPRTEAFDRGDKFDMYRECGSLREYVLVSLRRPEVQIYRRSPDGWVLKTFRSGSDIELGSLGITVPVDEVYEGIELREQEVWAVLTEPASGSIEQSESGT
ncbi:MAG TPA: Uma2 family endonuclease [Chloroflexota bacterium]|jgi:Uma2 family endonuclease|nr:Uma2 family endonuclease [Chloroflexota bacterium]